MSKNAVVFTAAQWTVAKAAGKVAKAGIDYDNFAGLAVTAYKDCKAKTDDAIKAVDTAYREGYMMMLTLKGVTEKNLKVLRVNVKAKDKATLAARASANTSLSKLKREYGIKVVDKRGAKKGETHKPKSAKQIATEKAKAKEVQTAAKALVKSSGMAPPDGDTYEATTKYFMQWAATGLAVSNKKKKVISAIKTAIATCHAAISKAAAEAK